MQSISDSFEHRKIRETRELLKKDAQNEWNSGFQSTTWRVSNLIGISGDDNRTSDSAELIIRILTNNLTRAERRKVREMGDVNR